MRRIECSSYNVWINDWKAVNEFLNEGSFSKVFVLVDDNTRRDCLPLFKSETSVEFIELVIASGEQHKTLETCIFLWNQLLKNRADRHSLLINLGGGVIGDLGGFVASTFMRGMHFIQMPTTLLSQVDASVGGKLGVDFNSYKNMIGVIRNPDAVFMFSQFLNTLPEREIRSGFAEVIKHGLIRSSEIFEQCLDFDLNSKGINWEKVVFDSVHIKKEITDIDPEERGLRKILNFGHTLGHAIESYNLNTEEPLLHGEAIAIGMVMESHLSFSKKQISLPEVEKVKQFILANYGHHPDRIPDPNILEELMSSDKKNKGGRIQFSLLTKIGEANYNQEVTSIDVQSAIDFYCS